MDELKCLVQRLEVAVKHLEAMPGRGGSAGDSAGGAVSEYIEAFDEIVNGPVAEYLRLSQKIGSDVQTHADMMKRAFASHRQFLMTASTCQKPSDAVLKTLLKPLSDGIQQVQAFREKNRSSALFNHLSAVSESVPALGWVTIPDKPAPYVKESKDSAEFYTNRVIKDFKEKDKTHVDWTKALIRIWTELHDYIKKHHTTGLTWSKSGAVASASAAPAVGSAPPPPPGPPPPPMDISESSGGDSSASHSALFASINKGSDITRGLKHVSDDQKTHKNPALRGQGAQVRTGPKPFASNAARPAAATTPAGKLPPMLALEGKKWRVENQEDQSNLVIDNTELKQVVYAFKCNKSTLQVKGKINNITLDNCKKMGLVFDDVVSNVDIINCKDVKVQVIGKVPTISIDKTDGCQVYLSKDSVNCEIVSAKSSEMNILVPKADGEYSEHPVPEQFKTVWDGKKLVTTSNEFCG